MHSDRQRILNAYKKREKYFITGVSWLDLLPQETEKKTSSISLIIKRRNRPTMNAAECESSCLCWRYYQSAIDPTLPTVRAMRSSRSWIFYVTDDENDYAWMTENSPRTTEVEWHEERHFRHPPTMDNRNSTFECGTLRTSHIRHEILHKYVDHPKPYDRRGSTKQSTNKVIEWRTHGQY